jgi:hypothetical protein
MKINVRRQTWFLIDAPESNHGHLFEDVVSAQLWSMPEPYCGSVTLSRTIFLKHKNQ